jgi:ABC-type uncharacterized transport system permease subunit
MGFLLFLKTSVNLAIVILCSILSFLITGSMSYVISSESFWATPCDLMKNPLRVYPSL